MKITMDYEEYLKLKECYATIQCKEKSDEIKRLYTKNKEEKKIPEKLEIEQETPNSNYYIRNEYGTKCALTKHSKIIIETLNQVIDYLKSKGE